MQRKLPISTKFFDAFGIIFWILAGIFFYLEETAGARAAGLPGDPIANTAFALRQQDQLLVIAATTAIIGTLFLGFSAAIKAIVGATSSDWRAEDHIA